MPGKEVARIEPEIKLVLATSLCPQTQMATAKSKSTMLLVLASGTELMQSRFADDSGAEFYEKLADGL
ncbi:hypothetical protein OK016_19805 [Vibrio chagasii]|nr:hypothetical protein [Vibrio chagasii]